MAENIAELSADNFQEDSSSCIAARLSYLYVGLGISETKSPPCVARVILQETVEGRSEHSVDDNTCKSRCD